MLFNDVRITQSIHLRTQHVVLAICVCVWVCIAQICSQAIICFADK